MSSPPWLRLYRHQPNTRKAVSTMTTEKHLWTSTQEASALVGRTASVCGCGQDLDIVRGRHCPRCGTTLLQAA
jgi:hypothetical protein